LLVGGTMLYFKALLDGLADMPAADPEVRAGIEQEAAQYGWPHIHAQLALVDPETAAEIHPNHSQRLSRALEVYRVSGKTMSMLRREQKLSATLPLLSAIASLKLQSLPATAKSSINVLRRGSIKCWNKGWLKRSHICIGARTCTRIYRLSERWGIVRCGNISTGI